MLDVMILAAGRGERLRPLTDTTPKPLLKVGRETLIEHHLRRLQALGFQRIVINLAWLGESIREHVGSGERFGLDVRYSPEPAGALETGGGIKQALPLLTTDPFIVVNGDILCDFDYAGLGVPETCKMHLVMVPNPPHHPQGDFALEGGKLRKPGADGAGNLTFAGIGCFRREVFRDLDPGRFPLAPIILDAIHSDQAAAEIYRGPWFDVGTAERLEQAKQRFISAGEC